MALKVSHLVHLLSSNVPLVVNIFKVLNCTKIVSVKFSNKFQLLNLSLKTILPLLFALLTTITHISGTLNWLRTQRLTTTQPPLPTWKYVLVAYPGFLYGIITIGLLHVERVRKETVTLLNASVETELQLIQEGM